MSFRNMLILLFAVGISMCQAAINDTLSPGLTNLSEQSDFTCVNRALGSYYPDYVSKCQKFHLCATGEDEEVLNLSFLCPEGAAFDERAADCLPGAIVNCEENSTNETSSSPRSVRKALKKDLQDDGTNYTTSFKCRGKKLGRYYADPETGCRLFHLCAPGSSSIKSELYDFQFLCLAGTLFDDEQQRCLEDGKVLGCNNRDVVMMTRTKRDSNPLKVERLWKVKSGGGGTLMKQSKKKPIRVERAIGPPSYDMDSLPETSFSCVGRVQGGYYADVESGCQMYHVCSVGPDNHVRNFKFLCSNGTVFSQQTRTCQTWYTVDCDTTAQFFALNDELPKLAREETVPVSTQPEEDTLPAHDNRDFLPSHRSVARQQQIQRTVDEDAGQINVFRSSSVVEPSSSSAAPPPRQIQQTTWRTPQFHAAFQDDQETTTRQTQAPEQRPRTEQSRRRGQGRRKRIRNRVPAQNVDRQRQQERERQLQLQREREEQQQQQIVREQQRQRQLQQQRELEQQELEMSQTDHPFTFPDRVTTPTVLVVDQGSVGFRSRITEPPPPPTSSIQEDHVQERQQFDQTPRRQTSVIPQRPRQELTNRQATAAAARPVQIEEHSRQRVSQPLPSPSPSPSRDDFLNNGFDEFIESAILEEARQQEEFRNAQIEQRRLRPQPVSSRRPSSSSSSSASRRRRPTSTSEVSQQVVAFQPSNVFVPTRDRATSAPTTTSQTRPAQTSATTFSIPRPVTTSPLILPELHEIPLFEVSVPQSSQSNDRWPSLQPVSANMDAALLIQAPLRPTEQLATPASAWSTLIDVQQPQRQTQQHPQQHINEEQLLLQQLSAIQQPSTMSDIFLLVPNPPQETAAASMHHQRTPASTRHFDFSFNRRQQRTVDDQQKPRVTSSTTPASQFLEYDSALLTAGGPSSIPPTSFTCKGKVMGGYYADLPTDCQMFHICSSGWQRSVIYDYRFLCGNGTGFDQRSLTCTSTDSLDCRSSETHYPKHLLPEEIDAEVRGAVPDSELRRVVVRVKRAVENVQPVSLADFADTGFRCDGRENGRYYADAETNCKLFHLCAEAPSVSSSSGVLQRHSFLCPNNTIFDQRSQACDDQTDALNCSEDPPHYGIDEIFARIP